MAFLAFHNPKKRRSRRAGRKSSAVTQTSKKRARTITLAMKSNPKKRRKRRVLSKAIVARRNPVASARGGSFMSNLKASLADKSSLYVAGGALLGNAATNFVLNQEFASKLPMMKNADGSANATARTVYSAAIPLLAAAALRRKNKALSDGLIVGSLINVAQGFIASQVSKDASSKLALFLPPTNVSAFKGLPVKFSGVNSFRSVKAYPNGKGLPQAPATVGNFKGVYNSPQAFARDAFAKS